MKWLPTVFALLLACGGNQPSGTTPAGDPAPVPPDQVATTSAFDPALAKSLRADEYGMAQYVIAFLKAGPNRERSEDEAMDLQRAHLDNIRRMADEGTLVLAGPFLDHGDVRGIYIFDVETIAEAAALTASDPAIQAGQLVMELRPWFGSAALRQVNAVHRRIAKTRI